MADIEFEKDSIEKFHGNMLKKLGDTRTSRLREDQSELEVEEITRKYIMPHMPQTLHGCYKLGGVGTGFGYPMTSFSLVFQPRVNMGDSEESALALGSITKLATKLQKGGWEIVHHPHADPNEYTKTLTITLEIVREIPISLIDKLTRRGQAPRAMGVEFKFLGAKETDRCKLVEEEITVKEHYVAEHKETRMKVVCDDN